MIVEALTDNRSRTAPVMRSLFAKYGGNLGETGSVSFMFNRVGEIIYPKAKASADTMLEAAIDAGADDVVSDEAHVVICAFENIGDVSHALAKKFGEAESVKIIWKPQNNIPVDEERAQSLMKLVATLEDDDDVQSVYANFEVDDETMAKLSAA